MLSTSSLSFCPSYNWLFPSKSTKSSANTTQKLFDNLTTLKEEMISTSCSFDQWMEWEDAIRACVADHSNDLNQLDQFLTAITQWGIKRNPRKTMMFLGKVISLETIKKVLESKARDNNLPTNPFELALKMVDEYPKPTETGLGKQVSAEWKRFRPLFMHLIPNLLNIFLETFNFFDSQKYMTLWDKHLYIEIFVKFCLIPYGLVQCLSNYFQVTIKAYIVATVIIVAVGVFISAYLRWLKPIPDQIVNCTNLDKQIENGEIDLKVGQAHEIDNLVGALGVHNAVLIRGRSGEGKTALIHNFMHLKHQGKLPKDLQDLTVFEADCGAMISNLTHGYAEMINFMKDQIRGREKNILIFFDDFYQIVSRTDAFLTFKKRFLQDEPRCKCILAVTLEEWDELKKKDFDHSFRRKTFRMKLGSVEDDQIRRIVLNYHRHFAQDVVLTDKAVESIIAISKDQSYLPSIGRAAKAEEILVNAVGVCRAAFNYHFGEIKMSPRQIEKNRKKIEQLKKTITHKNKVDLDCARLTHLFAKAVEEKMIKHQKKSPLVGSDAEDMDPADIEEQDEEVVAIADIPLEGAMSSKDQAMYLWYHFYGKKELDAFIQSQILQIDKSIPIHVNEKLIESIVDKLKESEG